MQNAYLLQVYDSNENAFIKDHLRERQCTFFRVKPFPIYVRLLREWFNLMYTKRKRPVHFKLKIFSFWYTYLKFGITY